MSITAISCGFPPSDLLRPAHDMDKGDLQDRQDLLEAEELKEKSLDEGAAYLQAKWLRCKQPPPSAVKPLITSPLYLAVWSAAMGVEGGLTNKGSSAIPEIPLRECIAVALSTCITFVALLDGVTTSAGIQRYDYARKALNSGLSDLAQALAKGTELNPLEQAEIRVKCNELIKSALGMPGLLEVVTQAEADSLSSLHVFIQLVANADLTSDIQRTAEQVNQLLPDHPEFLSIRSTADLDKFMSQLQGGSPSEQVKTLIEHQKENFTTQETWSLEKLGFGLATNVVSLGRSILELIRFSDTRGFLLERKKAFRAAIERLDGKAGSKILWHLFDSVCYKIKANIAAIVGGSTRLANAVAGIVIKSLTLGGIATGPAAAVIAPIVVGIYAVKNFVGAYYDRLARRNECEITNSIKIAGNDSSGNMANAINKEITADLESLVAGDLEGIKDFLEAMDRPELFDGFQTRFQKADTRPKQMAELQALLDACMPTSDALMNRQMIQSGDAPMELMGHLNQRQADAAKKSETTQASAKTAQRPAAKKSGKASLPEKFLRNPVDKAIAALTDTYPGWHLFTAAEGAIKQAAHAYLLKRQGDTAGVRKLLSIAEALAGNQELLRQYNPIHALIKGKTWQLSAKGQDLQRALESGDPNRLTARTLVAALTSENQSVIASCRPRDTKDYIELCKLLQEAHGVSTRPHLKTFVRALETCDGKQLLNVVQAMKKNPQLGPTSIQNTLKAALILSGLSNAQAQQLSQALLNPQSKASHADVSQALAIAFGQQLHARIADPTLRTDICGFLAAGQQSVDTQGTTLFVQTAGSDARWDLYAKDVTAGKSRLADTPDWLLSADVKRMLGTKPLGKNCKEALQEQFKIGSSASFSGQPQKPISLLWPSSVIKGLSETTLRRSFIALTGIDPGKGTSLQDMKRTARLYSSWTRARPSLATIEAIVRQPNTKGHPPRLDAQLALAWTLSPWGIRVDDATVEALRSTKNSKGFIDKLVDLVEDKQAKKKAPLGTPVVRAEEIKPDSMHDELRSSSANDSTWMVTATERSIDDSLGSLWKRDQENEAEAREREAMAPYKNAGTIALSLPGRGRSVNELMRGASAPQRSPNGAKKTSFKKQPTSVDLSKQVQQHRHRASSMDLVVNPANEYRLPDSSPLDKSFTPTRKHHPDFDGVRWHPSLQTKKSG